MSEIDTRIEDAMRRHRAGDVDGAIAVYRELVDLHPENADLWHLLGVAVHQKGNAGLAADLIETAISLNGGAADYYANLAMVRRALDDDEMAEEALRRAIGIDPGHGRSHSNLAGVLRSRGDFVGALAAAQTAVRLSAEDAQAHNNLGNALKDCGRAADAVASYRRAIALDPDFALAHWNLSLALASLGELQDAFTEMAWRWQWSGFPAPARDFAVPLWRGAPIEGANILLHAEQGLGDAIHFVRYAALVRARGARVIAECPPGLAPLVGADLADTVIAAGDPLPAFDSHAPFLDLPRIFGTNLGNLPNAVPYLAVDAARRQDWRQRLAPLTGLKVGLNWTGNPASPVERFRQLPLDGLGPLADAAGVSWVSLQKGPGGDGLARPDAAFDLLETGEAPLADTAALILALDLVITSDTAVAHLAGALGRPTWLLLHHAPDWRWMVEGKHSPWYPSLKLYRQAKPGDWAPVIAAAAGDLARLAAP